MSALSCNKTFSGKSFELQFFPKAKGSQNFNAANTRSFTPKIHKLNYHFALSQNISLAINEHLQSAAHAPYLSAVVLDTNTVVADLAGMLKSTVAFASKYFGATEDPADLNSLGMTAGFSIISGGLGIVSGVKEVKAAEKISDTSGRIMAGLKIAGKSISLAGGVLRSLSLAFMLSSADIIIRLNEILKSVVGGFSLAGAALSTASQGIKLDELRRFQEELDEILTDPETGFTDALEHLKKLASASPEENEKIVRKLKVNPEYLAMSDEEKAAKVEEKQKLLIEKKEAFLKRVSSGDSLKAIRSAEPADAKTVIEEVKEQCRKKLIMTSISIALACVSITTLLGAIIFVASPIIIEIIGAIGLVASLASLIVDGYTMVEDLGKSDPGRFDKMCIVFSCALAVIIFGAVCFFSHGIAAIIEAGLLCLVWFAINAVCGYYLFFKKKASAPVAT